MQSKTDNQSRKIETEALTLEQMILDFKAANIYLDGKGSGKISNLSSDSRHLISLSSEDQKKSVFFARKGSAKDGHDYLPELSKSENILGFVAERIPESFSAPLANKIILVRDSTLAMAIAAKRLNGDPTASALTVAVTGTNGKTTTTFLLEALLKEIKKNPVRLGTIEVRFRDFVLPSSLTTPDFSETQKIFGDLKKEGADSYVFEASSHAIDQRRLLGLELDAVIFTNLTPEHLDYHQTMENYYQAKRKLFTEYLFNSAKKKKIAIVPEDGSYGSRLAEEIRNHREIRLFTWSLDREANLKVKSFKTGLEGSEVSVEDSSGSNFNFRSRLVGRFNIENMMGMIAFGRALDLSNETIEAAFTHLEPVSGRLEKVSTQNIKASIFVDYAHTPDALENVLSTLRPLTKGRLKVVFGCGGDRDTLKRPKMGAIAELYADEVFITSDNPRTEDPDKIITEILKGVQKIKPTLIEVDRKTSILNAVKSLKDEDVLVIAGKGHENYQIIGEERRAFDDHLVVLEADKNLRPISR